MFVLNKNNKGHIWCLDTKTSTFFMLCFIGAPCINDSYCVVVLTLAASPAQRKLICFLFFSLISQLFEKHGVITE